MPYPPSSSLRIALCTVSMNRLHHIQQTLLQNIADNTDYPAVQFVLLDYGSQDGLGEWVKANCAGFVDSGLLVYYRHEPSDGFHRGHSRNLACLLADADVVCNVDADNFTGPGFAGYLNDIFCQQYDSFVTAIDLFKTNPGYQVPGDAMGRIACRKDDLIQIGGYDERMKHYGFEDYDLTARLEMLGRQRVLISPVERLGHITHDSAERYNLGEVLDQIVQVYISYRSPWESVLLVLLKDGQSRMATFIDHTIADSPDDLYAYTHRQYLFERSLREVFWLEGSWRSEAEGIQLQIVLSPGADCTTLLFTRGAGGTLSLADAPPFYPLPDELLPDLALILLTSPNRSLLEHHLAHGITSVNSGGFGEGVVYKNFHTTEPILL